MEQRQTNSFSFIRFWLQVIVITDHLRIISDMPAYYASWEPFNRFLLLNGHWAICSFFVISGFLITKSYMRTQSLKAYFVKRARRILPAYTFIVISCAFLMVFLSDLSPADYFRSTLFGKYLVSNLLFLNFLQPCLPGVFQAEAFECSVNPSLWTLKIEVGFYLTLPLLLWLCRKAGRRQWVVLAAVFAVSVLWNNLFLFAFDRTGSRLYNSLAHQLPGLYSYLACGMATCLYKDLFLRWKNRLVVPALLVLCVEGYAGVEWLTPAALTVLIVWFAFSTPALNRFAPLGNVTYGMYLYHAPLIKTLLVSGFFTALNPYAAQVLLVLLVVAMATLSWHLMEKPILGKRIFADKSGGL